MARFFLVILYFSALCLQTLSVDVPESVDVTPTADEIFELGNSGENGSCVGAGRVATINNFLKECVELMNAALKAYHNVGSNAKYRLMFETWLSMEFDDDEVDELFQGRWGIIGDRLAGVAQFLSKGGLINGNSQQKPRLFCTDSFAEKQVWEATAKDGTGKDMVKERDENDNIIATYSIEEVYPNLRRWQIEGELDGNENGAISPYWVPSLNGYTFSATPFDTLCANERVYARTSRADAKPSVEAGSPEGFSYASFPRHMLLCPQSFSPPNGQSNTHSVPTLADAVSSRSYPTQGERVFPDAYSTISSTLYHELFHLTDTAGTDNDGGWYIGKKIFLNSIGPQPLSIVNAPEPYVFLSMASYMYQNPPPNKPAVYFDPRSGWTKA